MSLSKNEYQYINEKILYANCDDDVDFMIDMIEKFNEVARDLLKSIMDAGKNRNAKNLEFAAHSMKSSAGALGAEKLAQSAAQLELATKKPNFSDIITLINSFNNILEQSLLEFSILRKHLNGSN